MKDYIIRATDKETNSCFAAVTTNLVEEGRKFMIHLL